MGFGSAADRQHNGVVEPDDLPDAEDLWWSWVVLAALHRAVGDETCRFEPDQVVLALDGADGSWLRMQRPHGRRTVLWGRSALAPESPPDARRGAPDWALTEATEEPAPTFLAWHAHGEWDLSAPHDEGADPPAPSAADRRPARRRAGALGRRDARDASRRTPTATSSTRPSSWCARRTRTARAAHAVWSAPVCGTRSTARCATARRPTGC